jgi:hypothetical protein
LIVLTVAMIIEHGGMDNLTVKGESLEQAQEMILNRGDGSVALAFTSDPSGDFVNITALFEKEQREEWKRMGMGLNKIGEA